MSFPSSLYQWYTGEGIPSTEWQERDIGWPVSAIPWMLQKGLEGSTVK